MIRIAICDDEQECVESLEKYIRKYLEKENIEYEIAENSTDVKSQGKANALLDENVIFLLANKTEAQIINISGKNFKHNRNGQINIPFVSGYKKIEINNIIYIESVAHKIVFHVTGYEMQEYYLYMKLSQLEPLFSDYKFIRIHQSYLVNPNYIKAFNEKSVELLTEDRELSVSKKRYVKAKKAFNEFEENLL